MQILRTLFWVLVAVLIAVFAMTNWKNVDITLWAGLIVSINLPFLILLAFLLGFLPTFLWYRAIRWRLTSRLSTRESELNALRVPVETPAEPLPASSPLPLTPAPPPPVTP